MKNHQINFRISEETYRLLKEYAALYDIDAATYAKICCIDIANGIWLLNYNGKSIEKEKNIKQINFRLSETICEKIKKAAEEYDLSVTQFVKLCCIQTAHNMTVPACTLRTNQMHKYSCSPSKQKNRSQ